MAILGLSGCGSIRKVPLVGGLLAPPQIQQHESDVLAVAEHTEQRSRSMADLADEPDMPAALSPRLLILAQAAQADAEALRAVALKLRSVGSDVAALARERDALALRVQKAEAGNERWIWVLLLGGGALCIAVGTMLAIFVSPKLGISIAVGGLTLLGAGRFYADYGQHLGIAVGVLIVGAGMYAIWCGYKERRGRIDAENVGAELVGDFDAHVKAALGNDGWEALKSRLDAEQTTLTKHFVNKVKHPSGELS